MKKQGCFLLAAIMILSLAACSSGSSYSSAPAAQDAMPSAAASEPPAGSISSAYPAPTAPGEYNGDYDTAYRLDGSEGMYNSESYLSIDENAAVSTAQEQTLTFSLKVDTASYTNVARYIENGSLPPADAVRTEELINYFSYDERMRFVGESPFALYTEVGQSPFDENKHLAFIRVKTRDIDQEQLPSSNLTFLIDTSGSMNSYDKLPLLKEAFALLVETLDGDDTISIVTYAGSSQVVLDSVTGDRKEEILTAINTLSAGGSTAGANGIMTAYQLAEKNKMAGGNNRVILATDGDFNVGISDTGDLADLVAEKRDSGVYLSILGFGTGNIRDDIMETLSKNGNGNYSYINSASTAKKVLVEELGSNLFTVADDVKAQVEFNPQNVSGYRLIGYENRRMANEDFRDDTKDAGEIGVGTDVVMMFELELTGQGASGGERYSQPESPQPDFANELFIVRIRYKNPGESKAVELEQPVYRADITADNTSDYRFASSVAAFGHLLRGSEYAGSVTANDIIELAKDSMGKDDGGYRLEYLMLLGQYRGLI